MQKITSRDNQKLKLAGKVRDGRQTDLIFVEGVRLAKELLQSDLKIHECFVSESFFVENKNRAILTEIESRDDFPARQVSDKIFNSLSDTKTSQGIIFIAEKPASDKEKLDQLPADFRQFPFLLFLHKINNPSNLGAVLRSAEAVGIKGVILSKNSADVFSAKSIRAAMGAIFRLGFWTNADFDEVLDWAREKKLVTTCADINAGKSFWEIDWKQPRLLIFGSEAHGLSEAEREKIEEGVYIPMESGVESLNLAVSSGVIFFEARRNWLKS